MQQPTRHGGILTENGFNIGLSAGFTAAVRNLSCECAGNRYQMAVLAAAPYLAPMTATLVTGFLYFPTDATKPFSTAMLSMRICICTRTLRRSAVFSLSILVRCRAPE
jgi:hypothetical protein